VDTNILFYILKSKKTQILERLRDRALKKVEIIVPYQAMEEIRKKIPKHKYDFLKKMIKPHVKFKQWNLSAYVDDALVKKLQLCRMTDEASHHL